MIWAVTNKASGDVSIVYADNPEEAGYPRKAWLARLLTDAEVEEINIDTRKRTELQAIKNQAAAQIEKINFPITAQMNAVREDRQDDPRFAQIDAIRMWSNQVEARVLAAVSEAEIVTIINAKENYNAI